MRQTKFRELYWVRLASAAILLAACLPQGSVAQQPGQKTFSSPQDASTALVAAVESNDEKAMLEILGPDGKEIISSGDQPRTPRTELISYGDIRKCTVW